MNTSRITIRVYIQPSDGKYPFLAVVQENGMNNGVVRYCRDWDEVSIFAESLNAPVSDAVIR